MCISFFGTFYTNSRGPAAWFLLAGASCSLKDLWACNRVGLQLKLFREPLQFVKSKKAATVADTEARSGSAHCRILAFMQSSCPELPLNLVSPTATEPQQPFVCAPSLTAVSSKLERTSCSSQHQQQRYRSRRKWLLSISERTTRGMPSTDTRCPGWSRG